ncbi:MAG: metallophosphoesterase [Candidatus Sericytochromatia bacterium]
MSSLFRPLSFLLGLAALLCACQPPASEATAAAPSRIVAIGDLHGDLDATRRALRLAGAIDAQERWSGGSLVVVQTGDQLDRGDGDRAILDLLARLQPEAERAGGHLYVLNGNHEIMNSQGDLRYVTPGGFQAFASVEGLNLQQPILSGVPDFAKARAAAFVPGGPYARLLAEHPLVLQLGQTVFVHGGLLPDHVNFGIERLNQSYSDWLAGRQSELPPWLQAEDGPLWNRVYSTPGTAADCTRLNEVLGRLKATRMVVGHTVQTEINSACGDRVWRIDVGMAKAYGGPVQVLEIQGEQVRVLREAPAAATP